jgi:hypothetical protein
MTMLAALFAAMAAPAAAQAVGPDQDSNGKALILVPLTLTKIDDLDFGTVVTSASSGVVSINATTGVRTTAGGVTPVLSDIGYRARFAGAGSPNQQVIVTVTPPAQLTNSNGDTIDVLALTLDGPPTRTIDPVTRAFFFHVGGVLMLAADQPEGVYQAIFNVSANYQ